MAKPGSTSDYAKLEQLALTPSPLSEGRVNHKASIPYGVTPDNIGSSMQEFIDFLGFINTQLATRNLARLESFLMPANFSSMVGEFMSATIPSFAVGIAKNNYHNGHPDLVPANRFVGDSVQHSPDGIEIKASRYSSGWQGHNPEAVWLLVFTFSSNRPVDKERGVSPFPFRFDGVFGAQLQLSDWAFAGRSSTSRRTITAAVKASGVTKMKTNWIYSR